MAKRQFRVPPKEWIARTPKDIEEFIRKVVLPIATGLMRGKTNNTYDVTLAVSPATTTTLSNTVGTSESVVLLNPRTATAAAAVGSATGVRATCDDGGTVTISHDASASTDRTFGVAIIG